MIFIYNKYFSLKNIARIRGILQNNVRLAKKTLLDFDPLPALRYRLC